MKKLILILLLLLSTNVMAGNWPVTLSNAGGGGWQYRVPIVILNSATTINDYQIFITTTSLGTTFKSRIKALSADIRFTDKNNKELNYWIDESTSIIIGYWVRISTLTNAIPETIYMFYGNASASSSSNGNNTFSFFDDFNDNSLDPTKWLKVLGSGTVDVYEQNNELEIKNNGANRAYARSYSSFSAPFIVEFKAKKSENIESQIQWDGNISGGINEIQNGYIYRWNSWDAPTKLVLQKEVAGVQTALGNYTLALNTNWYHYKTLAKTNGIECYYNMTQIIITADTTRTNGYIGFSARETPSAINAFYDNVFVRKYISVEPTYAVRVAQRSPLLPASTNCPAPSTTNTVALWRMNESSGTTIGNSGLSIASFPVFSNAGGGTWKYRKALTITSSVATQNDYQVYIDTDKINSASLISQSKLLANFNDLRFVDVNEKELNYWIDPSTTNTKGFWVKVSTVIATGNTTLFMYYGNSYATSTSSGTKTFLLFDDFSSDTSALWTVTPSTWTWDTGQGILTASVKGINKSGWAVRNVGQSDNLIIEAKIKVNSIDNNANVFGGVSLTAKTTTGVNERYFFTGFRGNDKVNIWQLDSQIAWKNSAIFSWNTGIWYKTKLFCSGTSLYSKIWLSTDNEPAGWAITSPIAPRSDTYAGLVCEPYDTTSYSINCSFDDVRVRKGVSTEPTVAVSITEESPRIMNLFGMNGSYLASGKFGNRLSLNGATQRGTVPDFYISTFTITGWVYLSTHNAFGKILSKPYNATEWTSPYTEWHFGFWNVTDQLYYGMANNGGSTVSYLTTQDSIPRSVWTFVAVRHRTADTDIFINGEKCSYSPIYPSIVGSVINRATSLVFGRNHYSVAVTTGCVGGLFDDWRICNEYIPDEKIKGLYILKPKE